MGPIPIRCQRNTLERYVCLFTCLASLASHLEVAFDLTTGSFLMALLRFLAVMCSSTKVICCDNGSNFLVAKSELKGGLERLRCHEIWDICELFCYNIWKEKFSLFFKTSLCSSVFCLMDTKISLVIHGLLLLASFCSFVSMEHVYPPLI